MEERRWHKADEDGVPPFLEAPNLPQTVIALFATLRLGGITVMTNPLYTAPVAKSSVRVSVLPLS